MTAAAGHDRPLGAGAWQRAKGAHPTTSPATRPTAVVVGLDCITGLQSARILAHHGIPVVGVAGNLAHPCCRTNACDQIVAADLSGDGLLEVLARLGKDLAEPGVLLPCTDLSVVQISRWREQLASWFHVALPRHEIVELLVDKAQFYAYAQQRGLPVPATFFLRSPDDAARAARSLRFPCIVKPTLKTALWKRHVKAKACRVSSREELLSLYRHWAAWSDVLIAQEYIDGGDGNNYTCNAYFDAASRPLVTFTSRKLRQWPPSTGEGCLSEECRNDIVEQTTVRLFQGARHQGLGYLEMKRDARTGQFLIVEPNIGRPTGRSAGAEAAGVALLYTMYCDVLGLPLPPNREQPYRGSKWIHFRSDLQSALYHWRRGELGLLEWLGSWRGVTTDALFSWRDPVPFFRDAGEVTLELWGVRQRRNGRRAEMPAIDVEKPASAHPHVAMNAASQQPQSGHRA
jgi:D-aspartate ligase